MLDIKLIVTIAVVNISKPSNKIIFLTNDIQVLGIYMNFLLLIVGFYGEKKIACSFVRKKKVGIILCFDLETMNLDFSLLGNTFGNQKLGHLHTLITLHLNNVTMLFIFNDGTVTSESLLNSLQ